MKEGLPGGDEELLRSLVPDAARIIEESKQSGHPYPSNNKIMYFLNTEFDLTLSKNQIKKIRKMVSDESSEIKDGF